MTDENNLETKENLDLVPENKEAKTSFLKGKKEGSFLPMFFITAVSFIIAIYWEKIAWIKDSVHAALDPSAGWLLSWNLEIGMILIVFVITLITTLVQKYTTDQKALKELREEQKILQKEMEKYKDHPEKFAELSKQQFKFIPKTMKLTSRYVLFTGIPFILFFRWFSDYFTSIGDPKFFGFLGWFWFYFIGMMIFSSIFRKWLKVI